MISVELLGLVNPLPFSSGSTHIISNEDLWGNPGLSTVSAGHIQIMEVAFRSFLDT
jgi:hypothetical protein